MNLEEKIKQEAGARTISLVMGIVTIALAFLCVGGEGVVPKLFALLFFAAYVFFVVIAVSKKKDLEKDLMDYIKAKLDEKLLEVSCTEGLVLHREKGYKIQYTIYANKIVTKKDVVEVMKNCEKELQMEIKYTVYDMA